MIEALSSLAAFDRAAGITRAESGLVQRPAAAASGGVGPAAFAGAAPAEAGGADFGQIMAQFAGEVRSSLRAGEATAIAGLQGTASAQAVVEAVMSAEQSLQTAVAIRDKVVSAYLELSRMAI